MPTPYTALFGELRSACATRQIPEIEALLCQILLQHPPSLGDSALRYAMRHVPAPPPWRWAWWLMCLDEGRLPTLHTADVGSFTLPAA